MVAAVSSKGLPVFHQVGLTSACSQEAAIRTSRVATVLRFCLRSWLRPGLVYRQDHHLERSQSRGSHRAPLDFEEWYVAVDPKSYFVF